MLLIANHADRADQIPFGLIPIKAASLGAIFNFFCCLYFKIFNLDQIHFSRSNSNFDLYCLMCLKDVLKFWLALPLRFNKYFILPNNFFQTFNKPLLFDLYIICLSEIFYVQFICSETFFYYNWAPFVSQNPDAYLSPNNRYACMYVIMPKLIWVSPCNVNYENVY